jgi:hypothetical protein
MTAPTFVPAPMAAAHVPGEHQMSMKNELTHLAVVIAFGLLFAACHGGREVLPVEPSQPSAPTVVTIHGAIGDQSLSPVWAARIEVLSSTGTVLLETHSDNLGRFELSGQFGGTIVTMRLSAPGYDTVTVTAKVDAAGECQCIFNMYYVISR